MAKKQKKTTPAQTPTKHQLSKWQRQMKIRRIVIIAAVVFLVGISSWVGYGYYSDYEARVGPLREVLIEVDGVKFNMGYYIDTLGIYVQNYIDYYVNTYAQIYAQMYNYTLEEVTQLLTSQTISGFRQNANNMTENILDTVATDIANGELLRKGAKSLNITVTTAEIDAALRQYELPSNGNYPDIVRTRLLTQKVSDYFGSRLPANMTQANVQVVLVESQEAADEVTSKVQAAGNSANFTALAQNYSRSFSIEGDLGWLPEELMPNSLIASAAFNLTPPALSQPIYDATAVKDVGYWLIEVTGAQNQTINALVMLLSSRAQAEQIRAQLAAGGNFSALAANYSQHASKTNGGKIDGLKRGNMTSTAFDAVAFNITLNSVSNPVEDRSVQTTGGYWLVKVIDRGDHGLSDSVKQRLTENRYTAWLGDLAAQSIIDADIDPGDKKYAIEQVLAGR